MSTTHDSVAAESSHAATSSADLPGPERAPTEAFLPESVPSILQHPSIHGRGNHLMQQAAILQLQQTVGNRVAQRMLAAAPTTPLPAVQRAKLNLRVNNTISGVSKFPKRPTSNVSGSQGQHLTAYVTFEDMILAHVKDRTLTEAAEELTNVLNGILALPGMASKPKHLVDPIAVNISLLAKRPANKDVIGMVIDNILSIRNKVPGTAERGTGGGHGEAGHSGTLETVESALRTDNWKASWDEDTVEDQCRYSMWRLLDYDPPNPTDDDDLQLISRRVLTHYLSLRMAYPKTFAWLTERESYLSTYMEAHRDDVGMPLPRVKAANLSKVFYSGSRRAVSCGEGGQLPFVYGEAIDLGQESGVERGPVGAGDEDLGRAVAGR